MPAQSGMMGFIVELKSATRVDRHNDPPAEAFIDVKALGSQI
jgi:hypothetical protein